MKPVIPALLGCFIPVFLFAQDVSLNDSVIFINNKPVALYAKSLHNTTLYYNMEVYSFDDYVLIKAEVIKFNSPVKEIEPFNYYELTFPPTADTFAIYIEKEDLAPLLAGIIKDYNLINKNELNKKNVAHFITNYAGGSALTAKIKLLEEYLELTRDYSFQVMRDRTKPVTIIQDSIIMQDAVKIGQIKEFTRFIVTDRQIGTDPYNYKPNYEIPNKVLAQPFVNTYKEVAIFFVNGEKVNENRSFLYQERLKNNKETSNSLFQKSKLKNATYNETSLLERVCFLVENLML